MRQLFLLECKKTVTGITYWLFVAVIAAAFWFNYGNIDKEEINSASDPDDIEISGNGAYVAESGSGSMNEAGQYVFSPDEWEYTDNPSVSDNEKEDGSDFPIQVSFTRFQEIMEEIDGMIGKNSYFSQTLINLYYGENDMDGSPVTLKQHKEFYEEDKITGAFARYYCDSIALEVLLFPAFVIVVMVMNDRRHTVMELAYTKSISGFKLIFIRYLAVSVMMLVPILLLPVRSFIVLFQYANAAGYVIDIFAFPKYILGWILPTLLFVTALSMFLSVLTESFLSVLVMGVFWLFFRPSVGKITGGNYELFDFVIRHNTLKGYGRMMQQFDMLVANRLVITGTAILFALLSVWIYQIKRKGGLKFNVQEFIRYRKRKL